MTLVFDIFKPAFMLNFSIKYCPKLVAVIDWFHTSLTMFLTRIFGFLHLCTVGCCHCLIFLKYVCKLNFGF